jgi:peroxiredoxin
MNSRKSLVSLVPALVLVAAACAGPSLAELAVGQAAPPFELQSVDGEKVSLAQFAGRTVVLEWFNPNCPVSRRHSVAKTMTSTAAKHPDVVWLGINSTKTSHGDYLDPAAQKKFMDEQGVDYPVLYDTSGDVGRAYGAKTTPHMYVVDPAGKIAYMGAIDDDPRGKGATVNYVDAALSALERGKPIEPVSTKPYGCSVKY